MSKELIKQLRTAKVRKEKKVLYNYAAYVLEKQEKIEKNFHLLSNRTNVLIQNNQNYFKKYAKKKPKYQQRNLESARKRVSTEKVLKYQRELGRKMRKVYELYKTGQLSNTSTNVINMEVD